VTDDLVYDSPEGRDIFLIALREFSESCRPPELIAACPYSIETEPDVRTCGEECFDILGSNKAPAPTADVVLDGGLTIQRRVLPRPRRGLDRPTKPFDAKEVFQEDSGAGEPPRWRLAALIYGLGDLVKTAPPVDLDAAQTRLSRIAELTNLIEARGLDVEKHLEHWLRNLVQTSVMSALRRPLLRQESSEFDHGDEWVYLLIGEGDETLEAKTIYHKALRTVVTWAQTASRDDLVGWNPPDYVPDGFPPPAEFSADAEEGQWLVDRFCTTYVDEWREASLRQEWQYLHGSLMPPCPATEMYARPVIQEELARVMADRFARPHRPDQNRPITPRLVEPAAAFLEEGRRVEAAALFEAGLRMDPNDADTYNNLGFCVLPDEPARAMELFEKAVELDPDRDLSRMNRVLALALLGKRGEAIDSAIRLREEAGERFKEDTGWLWNIESTLSECESFIDKDVIFGSYLDELIDSLGGDQERNPASEG